MKFHAKYTSCHLLLRSPLDIAITSATPERLVDLVIIGLGGSAVLLLKLGVVSIDLFLLLFGQVWLVARNAGVADLWLGRGMVRALQRFSSTGAALSATLGELVGDKADSRRAFALAFLDGILLDGFLAARTAAFSASLLRRLRGRNIAVRSARSHAGDDWKCQSAGRWSSLGKQNASGEAVHDDGCGCVRW